MQSNLDNSASLLPDYVDTGAVQSEAELKKAEVFQAREAWTENAIIRAAQEQPGAATNMDDYRRAIINATKWFNDQNEAMKRALRNASADSSDYTNVFNRKKAEVEELRKRVESERELDAIRQEQTRSLETREAGNYHTSWMGLQKPLKEASQTGLLVAAGLFALVALAAMTYAYRLRMQGTPDMGYFFRGGFRTLFRKGRYSS